MFYQIYIALSSILLKKAPDSGPALGIVCGGLCPVTGLQACHGPAACVYMTTTVNVIRLAAETFLSAFPAGVIFTVTL